MLGVAFATVLGTVFGVGFLAALAADTTGFAGFAAGLVTLVTFAVLAVDLVLVLAPVFGAALATVLGTGFLVFFAVLAALLTLATLLTVLFLVVLDFAVANFNLLKRLAVLPAAFLPGHHGYPEPEKRVSVL